MVFTRGRPASVRRLARYYDGYPGQLVVVDGSPEPADGLRMPARGEYLHRPGASVYGRMRDVFAQEWVVALYVAGCVSLAWHLLHGFQSAFHTMGWNHRRYTGLFRGAGLGFSVAVPAVFALMPVFMYFGWEIDLGAVTLLF